MRLFASNAGVRSLSNAELVLSMRIASSGPSDCPGPTDPRPQLMPIARHISTSLGAPAQPFEPINSLILRPRTRWDRDSGMDDSAVWPRASGITVPATAASMRKARRRLVTFMGRSIRLSKGMASRAHLAPHPAADCGLGHTESAPLSVTCKGHCLLRLTASRKIGRQIFRGQGYQCDASRLPESLAYRRLSRKRASRSVLAGSRGFAARKQFPAEQVGPITIRRLLRAAQTGRHRSRTERRASTEALVRKPRGEDAGVVGYSETAAAVLAASPTN